MSKDKILGYVEALIDNYYEKFKDEEDEVSKLEFSIMLQDLSNLRKFIEESKINEQETGKCKECGKCK